MSLRRYLPRLVLVAGALAAIATQGVVEQWTLQAGEALVPQALADTTPLNVRVLTAGVTSRDTLGFLESTLTVQLELRARDVTGTRPAMVEVELISTRPGSVPFERELISIAPGGTATVELFAPVLGSCGVSCSDQIQLKLRRTVLADDPIIDVTGSVEVEVIGNGGMVAPDGTVLELDVADVGPVP